MKPPLARLLAQGLVTLIVAAAILFAYDRWVLRPALAVGVVDVAEVYRAKEAQFTRILTQAHGEEDRQLRLPPKNGRHEVAF